MPRTIAASCALRPLTNQMIDQSRNTATSQHTESGKAMYLKGNASDACRPLARSPSAVHWHRGGRRGMVIRASDGGRRRP